MPLLIKKEIDTVVKSSNNNKEEQEYDKIVFYFFFNKPITPPPLPHTRICIDWDRVAFGEQLYNNCFAPNATYVYKFEHRFWIIRDLCFRNIHDLQVHKQFWVHKPAACGVMGLTEYQKVVSALKQLTLRILKNATNE